MDLEDLEDLLKNHKAWLERRAPFYGERAILYKMDLSGMDLSGVDLRSANLSGANLSEADLSGANLRGANLRGANLRGADLPGADLRSVNFRGANLQGANLQGANLGSTGLSGANLSGVDLSTLGFKIPIILNIDRKILETIEDPQNKLDMADWHFCDTVHCRAGWAITLAGEAGRELENQLGSNAAAALIYAASGSHPVPDWFGTEEEALDDMRKRAIP